MWEERLRRKPQPLVFKLLMRRTWAGAEGRIPELFNYRHEAGSGAQVLDDIKHNIMMMWDVWDNAEELAETVTFEEDFTIPPPSWYDAWKRKELERRATYVRERRAAKVVRDREKAEKDAAIAKRRAEREKRRAEEARAKKERGDGRKRRKRGSKSGLGRRTAVA
jgi:hypothetical protein